MSVLSKISRDEVRKRVPVRLGTKPRRTATALKTRAGRRATAGWVAVKGAAKATRSKRERSWPKRAGIAAAAAGTAGGAAAFLRDPERRGSLLGKALSPLKRVQTPNDETIAERVRSEVFRPQDAPKGSVNVNVEEGVVYLRGEVADQGQIQELRGRAANVLGVKRVESMLHTPGEPVPGTRNGTSQVQATS